MRHAEKLLEQGFKPPIGSPYGMPRSPHKRFRVAWGAGMAPAHGGSSNNSGNTTKAKRLKAGPPGTPQGICNEANNKGFCMCGKHFLINGGN